MQGPVGSLHSNLRFDGSAVVRGTRSLMTLPALSIFEPSLVEILFGEKAQTRDARGRYSSGGGVSFEDGLGGVSREELISWGGSRGRTAKDAYDSIDLDGKGFVMKSGGEVVGIASLGTGIASIGTSSNVSLDYLATREGGHGVKMMQEVTRRASSQGRGLELKALPTAVGFYEKIGMKGGALNTFKFTAEEAGRFAAATIS